MGLELNARVWCSSSLSLTGGFVLRVKMLIVEILVFVPGIREIMQEIIHMVLRESGVTFFFHLSHLLIGTFIWSLVMSA